MMSYKDSRARSKFVFELKNIQPEKSRLGEVKEFATPKYSLEVQQIAFETFRVLLTCHLKDKGCKHAIDSADKDFVFKKR